MTRQRMRCGRLFELKRMHSPSQRERSQDLPRLITRSRAFRGLCFVFLLTSSEDAPSPNTNRLFNTNIQFPSIICAQKGFHLPVSQPLRCGTFESCLQPPWVLPSHLLIFLFRQACRRYDGIDGLWKKAYIMVYCSKNFEGSKLRG